MIRPGNFRGKARPSSFNYWGIVATSDLTNEALGTQRPPSETSMSAILDNVAGDWVDEVPFGNYRVDFVNAALRIMIEVDDRSHFTFERILDDVRRELRFCRDGYLVLRFTNEQVRLEPTQVTETIRCAVAQRRQQSESLRRKPEIFHAKLFADRAEQLDVDEMAKLVEKLKSDRHRRRVLAAEDNTGLDTLIGLLNARKPL